MLVDHLAHSTILAPLYVVVNVDILASESELKQYYGQIACVKLVHVRFAALEFCVTVELPENLLFTPSMHT